MSIITHNHSAKTLRAKLFVNMLVLTIVLLSVIFTGIIFIGNVDFAQEELHEALDRQMRFFRHELIQDFENLAILSVQLSENISALIDEQLSDGATIDEFSSEELTELQDVMLEPVKQKLLQADCSGAFVLLDTTVNHDMDKAEHSRNGIYLQCNGSSLPYVSSVLLYRGNPQTSKNHGIMPHRKWRLEFDTSLFPNYDELTGKEYTSLEESFHFTDFFTLPGTSEKAILLTIPILGENGTFYGLCGFELSQGYFKSVYVQPTELDRQLCVLASVNNGAIEMDNSLSCGTDSGFYLYPGDAVSYRESKSGLCVFEGERTYIGLLESINITGQSENMALAIMIPKADYDTQVKENTLHIAVFIVLLLFFGIICCLFFSKKFLSPIINGLKEFKESGTPPHKTNVSEIDDLFDFIAQKDSEYEEQIRILVDEKQDLLTEYTRVQTNLERLVDKKSDEIDSDSFRMFLANLDTLTNREREIFDLYLSGKRAKEIHEILGMSENTVKFHNKNIYSKLGISSRKQLLQYATLMREQEERDKAD